LADDSVELVEVEKGEQQRIAREPNNTTVSPATLEGDGELWEQIVTLLVIVVMLVAMAKEVAPPDMLMMGCVGFFITARIITLEEGVEGFANTGMLTVAVLFAVAAGIQVWLSKATDEKGEGEGREERESENGSLSSSPFFSSVFAIS
jgi:hypothetical protein